MLIVLLPACNQEDNQSKAFPVESGQSSFVGTDESGMVDNTEITALDSFSVEPLVLPLIAGQHIVVGTITVTNTETGIVVVYETTEEWGITETHLDAALDYSGLHTNRSGNPIPGRFTYSTSHPEPVYRVSYLIEDLEWSAGMDIYLATHAVVVSTQGNETAWAGDLEFPGNNWATYFTYTTQESNVDPRGQLQFAQPIYETAELGRSRRNLVEIEVQRVGGTQGVISARYSIVGGTATINSDYVIESPTGVLEFLDGETSKIISIIILDDNEYEQYVQTYETIDLVLEESCCLGTQQTTQVQIADDEELN
ncbi:Calx-beta domain-containing protein [Kaarinaea lacus]